MTTLRAAMWMFVSGLLGVSIGIGVAFWLEPWTW